MLNSARFNRGSAPVSLTLNHLFGGGDAPGCLAAADINDSGELDIADPLFTFGYLFKGGVSPANPFPACGVDPTDMSEEDCETQAACQ